MIKVEIITKTTLVLRVIDHNPHVFLHSPKALINSDFLVKFIGYRLLFGLGDELKGTEWKKSIINQQFDMMSCSKCGKLRDNLDIVDWDKVICVYCELEDVDFNDPLPWLPLSNFKHSEMARLKFA